LWWGSVSRTKPSVEKSELKFRNKLTELQYCRELKEFESVEFANELKFFAVDDETDAIQQERHFLSLHNLSISVNSLVLDHHERDIVRQLESPLQLRSTLSNGQSECFQQIENEINN
jgi:hypothetical protein